LNAIAAAIGAARGTSTVAGFWTVMVVMVGSFGFG
jgi:uncharacterized membrane protein YhiD involved in acid resistance